MADSFGALDIPVPVPAADESLGDPAIDILALALPAILTSFTAAAWNAVAPGEPLFRKTLKHDPKPEDFTSNDLPALYIWREIDGPKDYTDAQTINESTIHVLWVEPFASQDKRVDRAPFYNAFGKCISDLVSLERDPSWILAGDTDQASLAYGSDIVGHCGFDGWWLQDVRRSTVEIPVEGGKPRTWPALLARIVARESNVQDVVRRGYVATAIDIQIGTGGSDPLVTGHIREPETP